MIKFSFEQGTHMVDDKADVDFQNSTPNEFEQAVLHLIFESDAIMVENGVCSPMEFVHYITDTLTETLKFMEGANKPNESEVMIDLEALEKFFDQL